MIGFVSMGDNSDERDGLEDQRPSDAIVAFLGVGLPSPPSRAAMVSALADARRAVKEQCRDAAVRAGVAPGERRNRAARSGVRAAGATWAV
ncbi:hypothetical protein OHA72_46975 [Dactylosporangium sp. NBC_01737]|uniref:hypothetical protein n=1 Tax=Dactylosporangium sp. NBC_01737 TaxID=2975959 RepID=UPI002E104B44|nr:hypothetical protein OHA72_46975 [Dactylosporangium sp. NBC_01737]